MNQFIANDYAQACDAARQHALEVYPNEACGAIMADGSYRRFLNVSANPTQFFDCTDERAPLMIGGQILAMIHSHPYERRERATRDVPRDFGPSEMDMRQQMADALPWGILATDGVDTSDVVFWGASVPIPELTGRPFRHGPSGSDGKGDCYALIKDYYAQELGIDLPEGPRSYDWWNSQQDLYRDNFRRARFRMIDGSDAKPGDVFIAQVNCGVPNHGGVLLDGGMILHHLQGRASRRDTIHRWSPQIVGWLRHADRDTPEPSAE